MRQVPPARVDAMIACLCAVVVGGTALAAGTSQPLRPGLWRFRNTPGTATLDGRPLKDLPAPPIVDESVCLTPADAAAPARWLARDTGADCTITRGRVGGGRVDIAGTCPAAEDGGAPGTLRLSGTATTTSYSLRFETVAHGDNGRMGFTGAMTGRWVGTCPAG